MKSIFKISYLTLFFFVIVLTFSCIFQVINLTQEKYLTLRYQEKINTISRKNYSGAHDVKNGFSLKEVKRIASENNFTETESITYLKAPATEVVVR